MTFEEKKSASRKKSYYARRNEYMGGNETNKYRKSDWAIHCPKNE